MACPSSGSINIQDLVDEFGGSIPHSMSEYYRNGGEVPGNNTNVPESGTISLSNFYSAVNEIQQVYSSNATNLNLSSIFGSNWTSTVPKRVVINSGVTIGATGSNHAINIPSGMGGTLIIDNNGNIQGHGGASNSGTGGNAVHCTSTSGVTVNNNSGATIKAGGGGGGQGGTGGTGGNGGNGGTGGQGKVSYYLGQTSADYCGWSQICGANFGWAAQGGYQSCSFAGYGYFGAWYWERCYNWNYYNGGSGGAGGSSGGAGGAGGAGGVGQGYNQSNTSGSSGAGGSSGGSGSAGSSPGNNTGSGGTGGSRGNGGQGGTGGAGGTFGNAGAGGASGNAGASGNSGGGGNNGNHTNGSGGSSGSSGSSGSGGSGGGSAGTYIYNRNSITFNNNGTVAGN